MHGLITAIALLGVIVCVMGHVVGIVIYRVKHGCHIDLLKLPEIESQGEKIASFLRWNTRIAWLFGILLIVTLWSGHMK